MATLKETFQERIKAYGCKNEDLAVNYFTKLEKEQGAKIKDIDFEDFVLKSITYSNLEIDPFAPDTITLIPRGGKILFIEDKQCVENLARRYGVNCPINITTEIIFSNDKFSLVKKDLSNPKDGYLFQVTSPLDRGNVCGGVFVMEYDNEKMNKAVFMGLSEIHKRTDTNSATFKKYPEEMIEKTLLKKAWGRVTLNTTKLAEYYSIDKSNIPDFEPQSTEDLPFDPDSEL
jgi:recombinational DNA repair protein RecT